MDTIAPLLKLSSSAPLRSNARRAAFVEPGDARPGSALLERDVYQSLSSDSTPVTGDCRYVISRRWLDDWESYAGVSTGRPRGPSTLVFPEKTLGFTLGLSNGALVVRSVKPTCAHSRTLSIGAALTHLNDTRVVCEDENEFTSLLSSLKQAERPLKLTFGGLDDALSPRPRRGADRPFTIRNADLLEAKEITDSPESPARLLRHLQQGRDYELLSQDEWQALKGWYGADATLQRFYVDDEAEPMLELYPCFVDVVDGGDR